MSVFISKQLKVPKIVQKPSSHTPGDVITWDDKEWLVCHYDSTNNRVYLIAPDTVDDTIFGNNEYYSGSTLAARCMTYQNESMSAAALDMCVDVTVNGVTAKVFVPSYDQLTPEVHPDQGFSWFNNSTHLVVTGSVYSDGYWTSSSWSFNYAMRVNRDGNFGGMGAGASYGFRPCVCVQL